MDTLSKTQQELHRVTNSLLEAHRSGDEQEVGKRSKFFERQVGDCFGRPDPIVHSLLARHLEHTVDQLKAFVPKEAAGWSQFAVLTRAMVDSPKEEGNPKGIVARQIKDLATPARQLRGAYLSRDLDAIQTGVRNFMPVAGRIFAFQSPEACDDLVHKLGPIIQASGRVEGDAGWRHISRMATWFKKRPQELEQQRWFVDDAVHGKILNRLVDDKILSLTGAELLRRIGSKKKGCVTNGMRKALNDLGDWGFIAGQPMGKYGVPRLYPTQRAEELVAAHRDPHLHRANTSSLHHAEM